MSNNPAKVKFLEDAGIPVTELSPLLVGVSEENQGYLDTKRDRMGHMIPETEQ
jgi:3,4-dihydroxy 2-butanone 4-phosphate synthase/GTP cyclohydrolase II